ncbi:MAG: right-handed parallel beta-helix repeat-containing protein [Victivallales bacterium]
MNCSDFTQQKRVPRWPGRFLVTVLSGLILFACFQTRGQNTPSPEVFYVNNKIGSDVFDGRNPECGTGNSGPFKSIMQAIQKCSVGARIEIANTGTDYRETVEISGLKKGQADAPLIIDGHGAVVNGLLPIAPEQWQHFRDDIYYFDNRVGGSDYKPRGWFDKKTGDSYYGPMPRNIWLTGRTGWFTEKEAPKAPQIFLVNGKPGPNVVKLEDLPPGGFFYDVKRTTLKDLPKCLFFRLPEKTELKDCVVELPQNDGIFVNDDYVTVQNIGSCYGVEDGFHGWRGQNVVFRNIHAFCNSEQGMSFHSIGSTFVDGGLIENNAGSGIVDVMSSLSIYRNVTVRNNNPLGVLFKGVAHAMYGCRIEDNGGAQISV